ncbi:hypothetical protein NL485_27690, partial [Klebsiella pneumoniae]|nr:hypothetical protein [Klebsiella pneumoniae]
GTRYRDTDEPIEEAYRRAIQPIDANPLPEDELRAIFKRYEAMVLKNFAFLKEKETMDTVDWARCQPKLLQLAYKHKFNAGDAKVVDEVPKII